jgi:hypothetical protein
MIKTVKGRNVQACMLFAGTALLATVSTAGAAPPVSNPKPASKGNACDQKLITVQDVAGLLRAPIVATTPAPGDPQSCVFKTANFTSILVSLRPGLGRQTVDTWAAGKKGSKALPLPGVGDKAVWVPDLQRVYATKNDLLCAVTARTSDLGLRDTSLEDLRQKLGALCGKILAGAKP